MTIDHCIHALDEMGVRVTRDSAAYLTQLRDINAVTSELLEALQAARVVVEAARHA